MKKVLTLITFLLALALGMSAQTTGQIIENQPNLNESALDVLATVPETNPPDRVIGVRGTSQATVDGVGVLGAGTTGLFGAGSPIGTFTRGGTALWAFQTNAAAAAQRAGLFTGNVEVTGTLHNPSDARLKKVLKSTDTYLDKIVLLSPKRYLYKAEEFKSLRLPQEEQYGFIAQELEEVFPQLVFNSIIPEYHDMDGKLISNEIEYKSISMINLIPILTKGIQELADQNEQYKSRIESLESELKKIHLLLSQE